jgi:competence protein ComEC
LAALGCLILGGAAAWRPDEPELRIDFLAVGQGDCALIRHEGWAILVDAGPKLGEWDGGERLAAPQLRELGVGAIDLLLITHPDADHAGGAGAIRRRFRVGSTAAPSSFAGRSELPDGTRMIPERARIRLGRAEVELAHFPSEDDNSGSLFLRARIGRAAAVMTGDAPRETEARAAVLLDWPAQLVKAGHHGSRDSLGPEWLAETRPEWVVFSAGRGNRYGHPAPSAVRAARDAGARTALTARDGRISFRLHESGRIERLN